MIAAQPRTVRRAASGQKPVPAPPQGKFYCIERGEHGPAGVGAAAVREVGRYVTVHGPCRSAEVVEGTQLPPPTVALALNVALSTRWIECIATDLYDRLGDETASPEGISP